MTFDASCRQQKCAYPFALLGLAVGLKGGDLRNAVGVAAPAERRREVHGDHLLDDLDAGGARAGAHNVSVIVLAAHLCGEVVVAERGTDPLDLVRGDGDANAGPAEQHAAVAAALVDLSGALGRVVGVVDAVGVAGPNVGDDGHKRAHLRRLEKLHNLLLNVESGVVGANSDAKGHDYARERGVGLVLWVCKNIGT